MLSSVLPARRCGRQVGLCLNPTPQRHQSCSARFRGRCPTESSSHRAGLPCDASVMVELIDITGRRGQGTLDAFLRDDGQLYR